MTIKVMVMEPISEVLGALVSELINKENGAGRWDRAEQLEIAASQASLPGFEPGPMTFSTASLFAVR